MGPPVETPDTEGVEEWGGAVHISHLIRALEKAPPAAWRSGNALCRINEVVLRRARLVLGWVTVYRQVNHLGPKPAS